LWQTSGAWEQDDGILKNFVELKWGVCDSADLKTNAHAQTVLLDYCSDGSYGLFFNLRKKK
jgi:hypothetical protein